MSLPTEALREYLLAFADDEHLIGQQHTEWIGVAPFLEEDLALASIGQDELGHAAMLYELVCELDGVEATDEAIDALAYGRNAQEYRSCGLVEYSTTDWAEALVRHWIYDCLEEMRWGLVANSTYQPLADAAVRAGREEAFHRRHADALIDVLMADPTSRSKLQDALQMFERDVLMFPSEAHEEHELVEAGVVADYGRTLLDPWTEAISARFDQPFATNRDLMGYGRGPQRSEHFAPLMARMREVLDLDPAAQW